MKSGKSPWQLRKKATRHNSGSLGSSSLRAGRSTVSFVKSMCVENFRKGCLQPIRHRGQCSSPSSSPLIKYVYVPCTVLDMQPHRVPITTCSGSFDCSALLAYSSLKCFSPSHFSERSALHGHIVQQMQRCHIQDLGVMLCQHDSFGGGSVKSLEGF